MRTVPIKAKFGRNFIYNLQTLNIKHKLKQLEIQKQSPLQTAPAIQESNALSATCVLVCAMSRLWFSLKPEYWCFFKSEFAHSFYGKISRKNSGEMGFFFFFQLSHKCHWSVLVMTKKQLILQGNSPAGLRVVWGMETPSNCTHGPLKLLSVTVICTAVTALVCFSLPSYRTLKYNTTCCDNTFWTWKALAVGTRHHRLPTAVPKESSFLFGSHAWWDAQVSLLSCVLLVFLIGRFETMQ